MLWLRRGGSHGPVLVLPARKRTTGCHRPEMPRKWRPAVVPAGRHAKGAGGAAGAAAVGPAYGGALQLAATKPSPERSHSSQW
ncbi:hypothetical protein NDU88_003212 [Pleurodeles waltl]|uniref:Uncharacterized protein n=1 Tax=Pleurodeles waltl TaxID=8319 RepID=A0AAV7T4C1_PLEWA|nr:hypothetical protein NDU88_003212 [Pleurodeles waltl]